MDFRQFYLILKARYKLVLMIFMTVVLITAAYNIYTPKRYYASAALVLNYKGVDPVTGMTLPAQLMPGYMATQIDIIKSNNVALKVVKKLKLNENPTVMQQFQDATNGEGEITSWLARRLLSSLEVTPSRKSSVLTISYTSQNPNFSALMANGFAEAYKDTSVELKVEPAKVAATFLNEQIIELKKELEVAQSKLSNYQQEHGITSVNGNLDVESARLNGLSTQLVLAQAQLYESQSRQRSSKTSNSPDVASNPLVQNLKVAVASAETKLSQLSERYGNRHPHYISAKAELDKQRSLLRNEINNAKGNVGATNTIYKQREAEIKSALAEQKKRVLELNLSNNQLSVLQSAVINAQSALKAASQRYSQTTQEGNSKQTDISILNPAVAPTIPSGPRVLLNILLSIFIGAILAIMTALAIEMTNQRVRSKNDIARVLQVPVFGVISNKPKKDKKILTALPRRLAKV